MRPEYSDAVDAVRWGWSFWLMLATPAALIWFAVFRCKTASAGYCLCAAAFIVGWILLVYHANHIQDAKEFFAQTDAEWDDWTADTGKTFAPITGTVYSAVYCATTLAFAAITRFVLVRIRRWGGAPHGA